jgi:hypothetical protein
VLREAEHGLSYAEWMRGQKAGRSFITMEPMLEWSADGRDPGDTLRLDSSRQVRVRARASSQFPMMSLELIFNGAVFPTAIATNNAGELVLDQEVKIDRPGWIAVRCASANTSFPVAHGNPIYIDLPGHPLDARADAEYFLAWIDRIDADLRKRDRIPVGLDQVKTQLDAARAVYRRLAGAPRR